MQLLLLCLCDVSAFDLGDELAVLLRHLLTLLLASHGAHLQRTLPMRCYTLQYGK